MEEREVFCVAIEEKLRRCIAKLTSLDDVGGLKDIQQLQIIIDKQIWSTVDKSAILDSASRLLLVENCWSHVASYLTNILPELYLRIQVYLCNERRDKSFYDKVELLLKLSLNIYCGNSLLQQQICTTVQWLSQNFELFSNKETIVVFYLRLLILLSSKKTLSLEKVCNIEDVQALSHSTNVVIKWHALKVLAIYLNILHIESFLKQFFDDENFNQLTLDDTFNSLAIETVNEFSRLDVNFKDTTPKIAGRYFRQDDFRGKFIPIFNMLLEYKDFNDENLSLNTRSVVLTKSTLSNLQSFLLAVLCEMPVLLSGGIGSGKTMLVEYLASCLGRDNAPQILKLQLGDQTDSKSLIGTYICAERPGEFKWQPGTLTQAVQQGSWLLLEDIDAAPSDIVSTLIPLIKTRCLTIPGHGDEIKCAPGFQIFATTRCDCSSLSHNLHSSLHLFAKLCHQISMEAPTKEELIQIVERRFPNLCAGIPLKMVDIYCMVSTDTSLHSKQDVINVKLPAGSRSSSPRDLFKWCSRISDLYHVSDGDITNEEVFLNAMQCFCSSIHSISNRSIVAYAVGAKLGLTKEKVEYYIVTYKPNMTRNSEVFQVGTTKLLKKVSEKVAVAVGKQMFSFTTHSLRLLEGIAISVKNNEPVLLVGETGCGKTSCVQLLAEQCGRKVNVINMSQQSDIADLLGGFKPMDIRQVVRPVKEKFERLFIETYSQKQNAKFLEHVNQCFSERKWSILVKLLMHCCRKAVEKRKSDAKDGGNFEDRSSKWKCFSMEVTAVDKKIATQDGLVFNFIEGSLVKSIQNGDWILLDEINLASAETLEYLSGLLDGQSGSMVLTERGDMKPIKRDENFRLFACMNPATDVGKKDLPYGIRNRFTEIYVDEINDCSDLKTLVAYYLKDMYISSLVIDAIVNFYLLIKEKAKDKLVDASGNRPHYSLRTLCRALEYAINQSTVNPLRAIYEGLCMSFLTQLDRPSHPLVEQSIRKNVFQSIKNIDSILKQSLPKPLKKKAVNVEGYWIGTGTKELLQNESYVLTKSVKGNLRDLARIVAGGKYSVLLQGETSVGKTSLISHLSQLTGNHCVRINNHEHTDIQEYIGCYGVDDNGSLIFKEGVLVTAMRQGHWIILDELNLAPTDVLEALNRLLDDNRELFIAETQEVVKAHPGFMLFATQNPPGHYAGRKMLSRAFRNRFVELHFGEIPSNELEEILHKRCHLPISYCKKFVKVMLDLQVRRRNSGIFAGKHSFMTLRDLFRWAERYRLSEANKAFNDWEQCICEDGFMLIGGRCRREEESLLIKDTLERNFKKKIDIANLYGGKSFSTNSLNKILSCSLEEFRHIVWTENMKRLAVLVGRALQFGEAALLVGETGCGKTTVCQLFSELNEATLYSVNCHMHTESADFLGGLRPVRSKEASEQKLFEWCDGPLVEAMRNGSMFLIDEISLADDSVLERLNSVLETERTLVLSERGEVSDKEGKIDVIKADEKFRLVATMNPGGDFGKKELSPALRNRFTEIWCSPSDSDADLTKIIEHNIKPGVRLNMCNMENTQDCGFGSAMVDFINWFKNTQIGQRFVISIRDILSWVQFVNHCCSGNDDTAGDKIDKHKGYISPEEAYVHGCCLVFIDSIGCGGTSVLSANSESIKEDCLKYLTSQVGLDNGIFAATSHDNVNPELFGIHPFYIERGGLPCIEDTKYSLGAHTTQRNAMRVVRGMQLPRPILLEGSPGVGKTSLVTAIAQIAGYNITRINLSEETDVSDLFGADLPIEGGQPGQFAWRDGPLLKALKANHWVVFDEMNLASQSVLEGLNACFDHRAEVFVPELNKSFKVAKDKTRIFACQNPLKEGGGRKGLPKSFLNRFTKVYVDAMSKDDLCLILEAAFAQIDRQVIEQMVRFNDEIHKEVVVQGNWGRKGAPWEFNVRDLMRWCELITCYKEHHPGDFINLIYASRMREAKDKEKVLSMYSVIFNDDDVMERRLTRLCHFNVTCNFVKLGFSQLHKEMCSVKSSRDEDYQLLRYQFPYLEDIMKCVQMNWMAILVGSESSGKNAMVGLLAKLTGQSLHVLSMNSGMDTTDFIGGFEQLNVSEHVRNLCRMVSLCINQLMGSCGASTDTQNLFDCRNCLQKILDGVKSEGGKSILENVENIITQVKSFVVNTLADHSVTQEIESCLEEVKKKWEDGKDGKGQFEWVDGILAKCLKNGHWLLIENVNFCSSSILDRLNGLLEPNGVLTIDECGVVNGEIPRIKPHPKFRLFMSMDPRFGDISRAMRNRGVEIYVSSENDGVYLDDIDTELLVKSTLTHHSSISNSLQAIYKKVCAVNDKVKRSSLLKTATLSSVLVYNGTEEFEAVEKACLEIYSRNEKQTELKNEMQDCIKANVSNNPDCKVLDAIPLLPSVHDFNHSASLATLQRICLPLLLRKNNGNQKPFVYDFMVSFERIASKGIMFALDYMEKLQVKGLSYYTDRSRKYDEMRSLILCDDETVCDTVNSKIEISRNGRRKFFVFMQYMNGLNDVFGVGKRCNSIMEISKQFDEGHVSAVSLPHQSVMYLYRLCKRVIDFTQSMWDGVADIQSDEHFAQLHNAYSWFSCFLEFCRNDLSSNAFSSSSFSVNKFSLHWKWLYERYFKWFGESLPDELKAIVKQVDTLLGHDSLSYLLHQVVTDIGIPKTFLCQQQVQLMDMLSDMYNSMQCCHGNDHLTPFRSKLIQCAKDILPSSFTQEMQEKVYHLKKEISNNSLVISQSTKLSGLVYQSLFALSMHQMMAAISTQQNVELEELQLLYNYGFTRNVAGMSCLLYLSLLKDGCEDKDIVSIAHTFPYMNSEMQEINFPDVSSLFSDESEDNQVCQGFISPCAPLLSMIQMLHSTSQNGKWQLHLPLNDVTVTVDTITNLRNTLWKNMGVIMAGKQSYLNQLKVLSCVDILRVLEGFSSALKNQRLLQLTRGILAKFSALLQRGNNCEILNKMRQFIHSVNSSTDIPNSVRCILTCLNNTFTDDLNCESEEIVVGNIACLSGLLLFDVTKPTLKYDPVEELQLRHNYLQQQLDHVESELKVRYHCEYIWCGVPPVDLTHPEAVFKHLTSNPHRVCVLLAQRKILLEDIKSIREHHAARPALSQYNILYQDFHHFGNSIGKAETIMAYVNEINKLLKDAAHDSQSLKNLITVFKTITNWINSVKHLIKKLELSYPLYKDITLLPVSALKRCIAGFNILLTLVKKKSFKIRFTLDSDTSQLSIYPSDIFHAFLNAPKRLPSDVVKVLLDEKFLTVCKCISTSDCKTDSNLVSCVLNLALLNLKKHLNDNLVVFNNNHVDTFTHLKEILQQYYMLWQHRKQKELEDTLEKEAFYRFKSQVHCEEKSDEEKLSDMQKKLFPSFDHEFSDLVKSDQLEGECDGTEECDAEIQSETVEIDELLLYCVVKDIYLERSYSLETNESMMKKYLCEAMALLKLPQVHSGIDYEKSTHTVFIMLSSMIDGLTCKTGVEKSTFNMYVDCDIQEAVIVKSMLTEVHSYVGKLLAEFEEHPALLQISQVIQRILSFSISSPVMKFLTGLEFLLKESQNWETYAGSHVSLRKHLEEITSQVIKWRKLELTCWPQLLQRCEDKVSSSVCKWFFHFYNLIEDVQQGKQEDEQDTFVTALKEFFENSTVGDFKGRIEIIEVFLKHMEISHCEKDLQNIVWNIRMYYKQFLPVVEQYMMEQKKPIEKELKDYVKIAKWNDINFFAMKQAVEKSHRTLNKFVGRYEKILMQPIAQFLKDAKFISQIPSVDLKFYLSIPDRAAVNEVDIVCGNAELYLNKVAKLQKRMKKHVNHIVKKTNFGCLIENLDGFTGDIISGIKELQGVDILSLPKEKQKSARNNLQQRKRKALSSLFKELKQIGLSYRKGMNMIDSNQTENKVLPKIEEHCCTRMEPKVSLQEVLTSCNEYFYKCQAKQSIFFHALCTPSKELGPQEVNRFKGLSEDLLNIAFDQRNKLSMLQNSYTKLGTFIVGMCNVKMHGENEKSTFPPQIIVNKWLRDLELMLNKSSHLLSYFKILLDCAPLSDDTLDESCTPYHSSNLSKVAFGDAQLLHGAKGIVMKSLSDLNLLKEKLHSLEVNEMEFPVFDWCHWRVIEASVSSLKRIFETVDDVIPLFASPKDCDSLSIAEDIIELRKDVGLFALKFSTVNINDGNNASSDHNSLELLQDSLLNDAEQSIQKMLISIQNLVQYADDFEEKLQVDEDDESVLMKPGHLVPVLTSKFYSHIHLLDMHTMNKSIHNILSKLTAANIDSTHQNAFLKLLPLLQLMFDLVEYYVFNLTVLHRTTCKLLFVLYGLFTDLVTQGYCIPPEEDGEVSGEGATEFEDIQGGGLGEGEGAKDVSDQIETEDQVEDTKHEKSEEKEKEEGEDIAEEKEGIEMSDDFDSKLQDIDDGDSSNEEDDDNDDDEEGEADKQMGEVDGDQQETVDDKMWGDSDEEEEGDDEEKEEKGPGAEATSQSQLVAKDENEGEQEGNEKEEKKKEENFEEQEEKEIDDSGMDEVDDANDRDKCEKNDSNEIPQAPVEELPDDLNLDKDEENEDEKDEQAEDDGNGMDEVLDEEVDPEENDGGEKSEENPPDSETHQEDEKMEEEEERDPQKNDDSQKDENLPSECREVEDHVECAPNDMQSSTFESTTQQPHQSDSNDQGVGKTESESKDGHLGESNDISKSRPSEQKSRKRKDIQHSKEGRKLEGENVEKAKKRKAMDAEDKEQPEDEQGHCENADMYQHMDDDSGGHDQLTIDAATQDQLNQLDKPQSIPQVDSDVEMEEDEDTDSQATTNEMKKDAKNLQQVDLQGLYNEDMKDEEGEERANDEEMESKLDVENEDMKDEEGEERANDEEMESKLDVENEVEIKSDFFTSSQFFEVPLSSVQEKEGAMENLRQQLERELVSMSLNKKEFTSESDAMELWLNYEKLTSALAQQLCEQLRLVLEPTMASKMRGDYRTGKRLNMRKVIPYIASQFRKDKIWLRRTKKSKRQYQIVLAVDDSSSMADNHSKQLAFESLAVISNALQWLEAGELAVCSFGEEARLIHPFNESFSEHAGASILQQFTFEQKNTKIAQLVNMCSLLLHDSKQRQRSGSTLAVSQLLLIVSDGRGIFLEGKETVLKAVRDARDAGVFIVFLIMDDPKNRDSILDIKVPIFKPGGGMPEIKSYIEEFPFPFYVLLRDINSLPVVLSDALRQWFELVTQPT